MTAFLQYLVQILVSVMMATFMLMMIPRAAVCAERIGEVLQTESSVRPPDREVAVYLNDVQALQTLQQRLGKDAQSRANLDHSVLGPGVYRGEDLRYDPAID